MILTAVGLAAIVAIGSLMTYAQVAQRQGGRGRGALMQRVTRYLSLTPEQQAQVKAIHAGARSQVMQLLTPAQQQAWQTREARMAAFTGMVQSLGLSAGQRAQLQPIMQNARGQRQAIRENTSLSQADRQTQLRALRQATVRQVMPLLSPAQRKTARAYLVQVRQSNGGTRGQGAGLQLTPEQRTQIKAIREKALADFRAILTPDQAQKLDQFIAAHHPAASEQGVN
jgi:Spy/CpxP family protein refolding chaperone